MHAFNFPPLLQRSSPSLKHPLPLPPLRRNNIHTPKPDLRAPIKNGKSSHPRIPLGQHIVTQRLNRRADDPPRKLMIIPIRGIKMTVDILRGQQIEHEDAVLEQAVAVLCDVVLDAKQGVGQDGEDSLGLQVADEFDDDVDRAVVGAPEDGVAEAGIEGGGAGREGDGARGKETEGRGQRECGGGENGGRRKGFTVRLGCLDGWRRIGRPRCVGLRVPGLRRRRGGEEGRAEGLLDREKA